MREWKNFEEERAGARDKALALLTDMDRTKSALRDKLLRAGFSEEAAGDALDYVTGLGYLDDDRYARHYVEVSKNKKSRMRIAYDLALKGLSREQIDAAMESEGPEDERPLIRELAVKKMKHMDASDPAARKKAAAFLVRRGFRTEDVLCVLEELDADGFKIS